MSIPYLKNPEHPFRINVVFRIGDDSSSTTKYTKYAMITDCECDKYMDIRVFLIFLSMIGFNYKFGLSVTKNKDISSIDSIDLAYWSRTIHNKLGIKKKPKPPQINVSVDSTQITPYQIEVTSHGVVLETFDIN